MSLKIIFFITKLLLYHWKGRRFYIDLVPRAEPISIASYLMPLFEPKELKTQLEDLIHKHFIRPNMSPYGAPVMSIKKRDDRMQLCVNLTN